MSPRYDLILFPPKDGLAPFTETDLTRTEDALGVRLPRAYVDLLRFQNGGMLRLKGIFSEETPDKWHTYRPVYEFDRIAGIDPRESESLTSNEDLATNEWGIPKGLVPIDGDGHWWLCLDYRACGPEGDPIISHHDSGSEAGFRVVSSFDALLRGLIRSDEHCIFAISDPTLRGRALDELLRAAGCTPCRQEGMWDWKAYQGNGSGVATVSVQSNSYTAPASTEFPELPAEALLLRLDVSAQDEDLCAHSLAAALNDRARLVHHAPERPPLAL